MAKSCAAGQLHRGSSRRTSAVAATATAPRIIAAPVSPRTTTESHAASASAASWSGRAI